MNIPHFVNMLEGEIAVSRPARTPRRFTAISWTPGAVRFELNGDAGAIYRLETCADLQTWSLLGMITNDTGTVTFTDP